MNTDENQFSVNRAASKKQIPICSALYYLVLVVAYSIRSFGQPIGTAMVPEDVLKATVLIERMETSQVTKFLPVTDLADVIQKQGTNMVHVPTTNFFTPVQLTETNFAPLGSGVLLSWKERFFVVTAGHVIPKDENVFFRIPKKNGQSPGHGSHKTTCEVSGMGWARSTNADLTLTTIYLNAETDDVKVMTLESFAATYDKVAVGDDVFVVGYPSSVTAVSDPSVHVIRNGIVAGKLGNGMILIDAFTFPGNSGGPVFWKPSLGFDLSNVFPGMNKIEPRQSSLVGIVVTSHLYTEEAFSPTTGRKRITFESNSGLTEIISTSQILELFNYPQVQEAISRWNGKK